MSLLYKLRHENILLKRLEFRFVRRVFRNDELLIDFLSALFFRQFLIEKVEKDEVKDGKLSLFYKILSDFCFYNGFFLNESITR